MLTFMSTLPQPLQFTSLMIVSMCLLGCCLLCVCVNPAAALSWLMWCQQILQKWIYAQGAHIPFLWTSWIQICLSQTHRFNPVKISLAFLHYHCNGNLLPFYFKALQKGFTSFIISHSATKGQLPFLIHSWWSSPFVLPGKYFILHSLYTDLQTYLR